MRILASSGASCSMPLSNFTTMRVGRGGGGGGERERERAIERIGVSTLHIIRLIFFQFVF